ncbi:hypothetical protein BD779DRAFT_1553501 [Infundibulicybe gibba]|nr:hypothetical protein BD779DRAFT_1553501 [Infundibulicybe gibba]
MATTSGTGKDVPETPASPALGAINRLVRSLSSKSTPPSSLPTPTAAALPTTTSNNVMDPVVEVDEAGLLNGANTSSQNDEQAGDDGARDASTAKQRFHEYHAPQTSFSKSSAEFPPQHWDTYIPSRAFPNAQPPIPTPTTPPIPDDEVPQDPDPLSTPTVLARKIRTLRHGHEWAGRGRQTKCVERIRGGEGEEGGNREEDEEYSDDRSGVMMYSPLLPSKADLVELADSELVPIPGPSTNGEPSRLPAPDHIWNRWPFAEKPPEKSDEPQEGRQENGPMKTRTVTQRVWRPSTTKMSLQALWWGYRIYLPPPILLVLSDKQLEAAKRAALITTALTWFFSHLPISSLPMPLQPALLLLQRLIPYVGYIGTFISWSWSSIKSYDKGFGVILSATWILPVALLPGTWEERDFPKADPVPDVPPISPTPPPPPSAPKEPPPSAIPDPPPPVQVPSKPSTQPDPPAQIPSPADLPSPDTTVSSSPPSNAGEAKAQVIQTQDGDKVKTKEKSKGKGFLRLR